ncbi:MAG TPA: pre-peptidase C-terminal domain-containing protein, partial [Kribbellaceae bacterium]
AVTAGGLLVAGLVTAAAATADTGPLGSFESGNPPKLVTSPAPELQQVAEHGSTSGPVALTATAATATSRQVCAGADAKWLRVRVAKLDLRGADSITLTGRSGGATTLTSRNWQGKAFHSKAFEGRCVTVTPKLSDPASGYSIDSYQSGTQSLVDTTVTVAGAGDICGSACNQTRAVLDGINPDAVYTAGDNAYDSGTLSEYTNNYDPEWGAYKSITHPTPGNHEYNTSNASGYFDYFNGSGQSTGPAGERGKGYYSWDIGDWHFIALNSNLARTAGSTQETWLRNDLAATTKPCVAAYWHHSRFAAGNYSDDNTLKPFFQALYDYHADLVLSGHDHNYIRFAPSKPDGTQEQANGVRELLVGTGGRALYGSGGSTAATIEKSNYSTFGVEKLTLTATGYTADFVPVSGRTFTDSVTGTCHAKGSSTTPDYSVSANPSSVSVQQGGTGTSTVTVTSTGGFSSATSLTASGLPSGVTASFNPSSVTPAANGSASSTLTFTASATATTGSANVTVTATSGSKTHTATIALNVTSSGGGTVLSNGVPVTNLSGATGSSKQFTMVVPSGATNLKFVTSGGSGDADLYVKFGSAPTTASYDCKSDGSTTSETCSISTAQAGTYYVLVYGYSAYSGVSLTGSYTTSSSTVLTNGVPVTNLSGAQGSSQRFTMGVPAGA